MIQRIQTIWLLLAAVFSAGLFMFDILTIKYSLNNQEMVSGVKLLEYNYLLAAIAIFAVVAPGLAIFMYKKRKNQKWTTIFAILLNIAFIALFIILRDSFIAGHKPPVQSTSYGLGSFLPVFSIIFLVLAIRGINKDEKLVKSLDRLR